MTLSDIGIMERIHWGDLRIDPFATESPPGKISYGLSSAGYDLRLARVGKLFTNTKCAKVDPKRFTSDAFIEVEGDEFVIPPNSFMLGSSVETLKIPRDVICTCLGKSTYARCGVIVTVTPLEPEWEGQVTVEISNTSPCPAVVFTEEGILQVLFHVLDRQCRRSYADKKGRYQNQVGITLPFVR